jgi:hypothetical protein
MESQDMEFKMITLAAKRALLLILLILLIGCAQGSLSDSHFNAHLPKGVKAVWDLEKAYSEKTPTRGRVCLNGLWLWQPANNGADAVPTSRWGYFKVPGSWPGITDYMQKDCQTVYAHSSWKNEKFGDITAAWYQREITIPMEWVNRRITVYTEYLNSFAIVYINGMKAGEIRFPWGEADLTSVCRPGGKYVLSMLVMAMPLKSVLLSFNDTLLPREVKGSVKRRGLCGDVYLAGEPLGARIADVKIDTSVRKEEIMLDIAFKGLDAIAQYTLYARITEKGRIAREFTTDIFRGKDTKDGRIPFTSKWKPEKLWDLNSPQNMYQLQLSLMDAEGKLLDTSLPEQFGFREFWIEGRDFFLNGTRIFLSSVPLDNAQIGAAQASYEGARESLLRLQSFGINFVYTHNYGCEPGSNLSFTEVLRAADDVGMLVALSQPHFRHYEWQSPDAGKSNGYAQHAEFFVRMAQNHPSVIAYATSHNAAGYSEDMNPDMIDGISDPRDTRALKNAELALKAESILKSIDPGRIVYHHSSGNLGSMHTSNFYPNFVPIQEQSDWFEHWATVGIKPVFLCEYGAPFSWDWAMYRGWYKGNRAFGSAKVPWEFCLAEWNAQFFGDQAYRISEMEKENLRWEAKQFRAGNLWHRWDYPHALGTGDFDERQPIFAMYITDNWRAFRTWGVSAISPWKHKLYWKPRNGIDKNRRELKVDWENLQRPGFSADYVDQLYERMDLAFERSDWIPSAGATALIRNNGKLLAYIAGKPERFTSKDHNFLPGETVEKQIIVINNSRKAVRCDCSWTFQLPNAVSGAKRINIETGEQARIPISVSLPENIKSGSYKLIMTANFSPGEKQEDEFAIHVLPQLPAPKMSSKIALFDPKGDTEKLLKAMGVRFQLVESNSNLSYYELLIIGRQALTLNGQVPDIGRVPDGLKVVVFEQTSEALEKRLGFRVQEYGLRQVFPRLADHAALSGLKVENLRDWQGEATIVPPRLKYELDKALGPTIEWCGIKVPHTWRCGNRGNVATVLIEKPTRGDFMPVLDGGFSLQYSPLLEYREGKGMILFCQMDVTGRSENEPAAETLVRNILQYVSGWNPEPGRKILYAGDSVGEKYLKSAGFPIDSYPDGNRNLSAEDLLIVGPGGEHKPAGHAPEIASWLKAGGNLLAIGLNEEEASAFLPFKVGIKKGEHISAYFEASGTRSMLAGLGPADVHNRDPRELPLVTSGVPVVGNGVLAKADGINAIFCQLVPWRFEYENGQYNIKRTHRRVSFLMTRLLANMGARGSTPLLAHFLTPVDPARAEKRWLKGLYNDVPEEWDDPYRFFRW